MTKNEARIILGVGSNPTADELKKAYRKMAMKHHPDKGGDEEEFKKLNSAYHLLTTGKTTTTHSSGSYNMTPEIEELLKDIAIGLAVLMIHQMKRSSRRYKPERKKTFFEKLKDIIIP